MFGTNYKHQDGGNMLRRGLCKPAEDTESVANLFSSKVKTRARLASQKAGSMAISLVSASSDELRRCTCAPNKALHHR